MPASNPGHPKAPLDVLAERLTRDFVESQQVDPETLQQVIDELVLRAQRWTDEPLAVVNDVVFRFLARAASGDQAGVRPEDAGGLLVVSIKNAAVDEMRRVQRHESRTALYAYGPDFAELLGANDPGFEHVLEGRDDQTARLLQADSATALVQAAMTEAAHQGDDTVVKVIASWLDLAQLGGKAPSTRAVAEMAGVSHTTVATALRRFRKQLSKMRTAT